MVEELNQKDLENLLALTQSVQISGAAAMMIAQLQVKLTNLLNEKNQSTQKVNDGKV